MLVGLGSLMLSTEQARAVAACQIVIEKIANPADNTEFVFTAPDSDNPNFTLKDPSEPITTTGIARGVTTTVTEEVPPGWILDVDKEECTGDTDKIFIFNEPNGLRFNCESDNATVTCTFFNEKIPTPNVPTLSEWGLIAMAGILGIIGFMVIRRRKATV
jgi:hypothetical protein